MISVCRHISHQVDGLRRKIYLPKSWIMAWNYALIRDIFRSVLYSYILFRLASFFWRLPRLIKRLYLHCSNLFVIPFDKANLAEANLSVVPVTIGPGLSLYLKGAIYIFFFFICMRK